MPPSGPFPLLWLQYRYNGKSGGSRQTAMQLHIEEGMQQYRLVLVPGQPRGEEPSLQPTGA